MQAAKANASGLACAQIADKMSKFKENVQSQSSTIGAKVHHRTACASGSAADAWICRQAAYLLNVMQG